MQTTEQNNGIPSAGFIWQFLMWEELMWWWGKMFENYKELVQEQAQVGPASLLLLWLPKYDCHANRFTWSLPSSFG